MEIEDVDPSYSSDMPFFSALSYVAKDGQKMSKSEWNDPEIYGILLDGKLKIKLKDKLFHDWIINDGDLAGEDWFVF